MKCFHHDDQDGLGSAMAVYQYYKDEDIRLSDFIMCSYDQEPDISGVKKDEKVFVLDFSFDEKLMEKLCEKTNNIVWLDHHESSKNKYYQHIMDKIEYSNIDMARSGALLTYLYFNPPRQPMFSSFMLNFGPRNHVPEFYRLTDIYDRFADTHKDFPIALRLNFYFNSVIDKPIDELAKIFVVDNNINKFIEIGESIELYEKAARKKLTSSGFYMNINNKKAYVVNTSAKGSFGFPQYEECDYLIVFRIVNDKESLKYSYSIYSDNKENRCDLIAKKYGGGGHKGASGFTSNKLLFSPGMNIKI